MQDYAKSERTAEHSPDGLRGDAMSDIQATTAAASAVQARARAKVFFSTTLPKVPPNAAVVTKGTFDLIHAGHLALIAFCAEQAAAIASQQIVVIVESDDSVRARKGPKRPIQPQEQRALQIALLSDVQIVILARKDELPQVLEHVQPAVYVKGIDTTGAVNTTESSDQTMALAVASNVELTFLPQTCRVVVFTDDGSLSTSALIRQIQTGSSAPNHP
ncbi:adenylyltransferase/cytidyltransferase family protein [Hydrogenophaga borbori]|uniref:adenylyltransferase/cytidyltransferase family protein n=1 Tax=Hydrogenophaga borbori TaxID=2294117 RepID=UPI00301D1B58